VPESVAGMATHVPAFLDGLGMLLTYPDTGHGLLFQWHDSFQHHVSEFLVSNSPFSPY
jgi:hypothetical protein